MILLIEYNNPILHILKYKSVKKNYSSFCNIKFDKSQKICKLSSTSIGSIESMLCKECHSKYKKYYINDISIYFKSFCRLQDLCKGSYFIAEKDLADILINRFDINKSHLK